MKKQFYLSRLALGGLIGLSLASGTSAATKATSVTLEANPFPVDHAINLIDLQQLQSTGVNGSVMTHYDLDVEQLQSSVGTMNGLVQVLLQDQFVEARINNDGEGLTGDILPQVMAELGYDDFTLPDQQLASGTLPSAVTLGLACHNTSAVWQLNMNDIQVNLPLDHDSLVSAFTDNERINSDLALDGLSLEFELQFYYPYNVGGFYCNTLSMGTNYNFRVNVNVSGASGEFDVKVDAVNGKPVVDAIKKMELDVDSVTFDSSLLTSLTNLGIGISNLFGSGCSTLTECVNNALDDQLSNDIALQNQIKDAINAAIDRTLTIEGATNLGSAEVDYTLALQDVDGDNSLDRLASIWELTFASNQPDDPCAALLSKTLFIPGNGITTGNDFELVVPFKNLTDLIYTVGKKGGLCATTTVPGTPMGVATLSVAPAGHVDVDSVTDNIIELTLPMAAAVSVATATGSIDADLVITAELSPACGAGLSLKVLDVAFINVAGSISWNALGQTITVDATSFATGMANSLAADIEAALDGEVSVLPESFGLQDIARYVATGDIVSNNSAIAVGLNVVDTDPNCN